MSKVFAVAWRLLGYIMFLVFLAGWVTEQDFELVVVTLMVAIFCMVAAQAEKE